MPDIIHTSKRNNRLYMFILCALFAALTVVGTFIQFPLPFTPVNINLALLSVYLAGGLLGPKYGILSQVVFLLLGAVGLPVFSNFSGGIGVLVGPTGGYLAGYILAALTVGLIVGKHLRPPVWRIACACFAGMLACYIPGTIWFMIYMNVGLIAALAMCVVPFLLGDALKITAAVILIRTLRRFVQKQ